MRRNPWNSCLSLTRPGLDSVPQSQGLSEMGVCGLGGGSSQSSGSPRILLSTSWARQREVTRSPFLTTILHPASFSFLGECGLSSAVAWPAKLSSFFSCRSICFNTFRLTGKNTHSRAGSLLGSGWRAEHCSVCVCARCCQGVSASLFILGAAGLGVRYINGTWPGKSRDTA